jgi:NADH dehydrogenase
MSSDQWKLLKRGSIATGALPGCAQLGVQPRPLGLFLDRWMVRFRKHGRFGGKRDKAHAAFPAPGGFPTGQG